MRALTIARRELYTYLRSPLGSAIIAAALLVDGILFYWQSGIDQKLLSAQVLQQFFYNATAPTMGAGILLSMRLLAEERQSGTITLLNTAPIRDRDIVAGKFMSAFGMVTLMNLLTFYMPLMLYIRGQGERRPHRGGLRRVDLVRRGGSRPSACLLRPWLAPKSSPSSSGSDLGATAHALDRRARGRSAVQYLSHRFGSAPRELSFVHERYPAIRSGRVLPDDHLFLSARSH